MSDRMAFRHGREYQARAPPKYKLLIQSPFPCDAAQVPEPRHYIF